MLPVFRIVHPYNAVQRSISIQQAIEEAMAYKVECGDLPVEIHLKVKRTKQQSFAKVEELYKKMLQTAGIQATFGLHVSTKNKHVTEYIIHTYVQ